MTHVHVDFLGSLHPATPCRLGSEPQTPSVHKYRDVKTRQLGMSGFLCSWLSVLSACFICCCVINTPFCNSCNRAGLRRRCAQRSRRPYGVCRERSPWQCRWRGTHATASCSSSARQLAPAPLHPLLAVWLAASRWLPTRSACPSAASAAQTTRSTVEAAARASSRQSSRQNIAGGHGVLAGDQQRRAAVGAGG